MKFPPAGLSGSSHSAFIFSPGSNYFVRTIQQFQATVSSSRKELDIREGLVIPVTQDATTSPTAGVLIDTN